MKALDFLKKVKEKNSYSKKYIDKEFYLWWFLREKRKEPKGIVYFRPYKLDESIAYYAKRTKKGNLTPISEEEYYEIWDKIRKEKKINGKQITPSPSVRFVMQLIVPAIPENGIEADTLFIHELSRTEFERIVKLEEETLKGNYADYFKEIGKTPEEMGVLIKREYKAGDKVPQFEYYLKVTSKGITPVTYEYSENEFESKEFDIARYYIQTKSPSQEDGVVVEEITG